MTGETCEQGVEEERQFVQGMIRLTLTWWKIGDPVE